MPQDGSNLSPDAREFLRILHFAAQRAASNNLSGLALVALGIDGKLIAHHLAPHCDPHQLRGYILEMMDEIREAWIKPQKSELCAPDGTLIG